MKLIKTIPMFVDATSGLSSKQSVMTGVKSEAKSDRLLLLAILVIGVFYLLTIRQGHDWGDDFSMYIQHAKNIVEGASYNSTGYIYFPPYIGPDTYPPVYPLFLVPVVWMFGLNLTAMKVELILAFMLALFLLAKSVKDYLPANWQVVLIALVGLNPYFWEYKDHIMSETPFLVGAFLSVYLVQKSYEVFQSGAAAGVKVGYVLATGAAFYLAYGTRSIALVLLPSLVLYDLIRHRRLFFPSVYVWGVTAVTIVLIVTQYFLLRSDRTYVELVQVESRSFLADWMQFILMNAPRYTASITQIWDNGYSELPRLGLTVVMSSLALIGFLAQVVKKITFIELFVALYTISIVIVPMDGGVRYMLPVVPFFIFYSLQGLRLLPERMNIQRFATVGILVAVAATYVSAYTAQDFSEIRNGITKAEAVEFFDYIKRQTSESDVVIFTKPRALALYTGRKSSFYPLLLDDKGVWDYFRRIKATRIVVGPKNGIEQEDQEFLVKFLGRYSNFVREEYANKDFIVYSITSMPTAESLGQVGK